MNVNQRKRMGEWLFLLVLIGILVFLMACEGGGENDGNETGSDFGSIWMAELSSETEALMVLFGNSTEWIYEYVLAEEYSISLTLEYYEQGERLEDYGPILNSEVKGDGWIVLDYNDGEFLMGIGNEQGNQGITTSLPHPDSMGQVKHTLEERISLEPGDHYLGGMIFSGDGRIESRGITDEEGIPRMIEENDYVYLFMLTLHE